MAKLFTLLALTCLLPALVTASERYVLGSFKVHGSVYCDTCRAGFETNVTTYMPGAKVKLQCIDKDTLELKYENYGVTDSHGKYEIKVDFDHKDEICDCMLVSSSQPECAEPCSGRGRARVIVTRNNGMIYNTRFANAMGFLLNKPLPGCTELIKSYFVE